MSKPAIAQTKTERLRERALALSLAEFCSLAFMVRALNPDQDERQSLKILAGRAQVFVKENPSITVHDLTNKLEADFSLIKNFGGVNSAMRRLFLSLLAKFNIRMLGQNMQEISPLTQEAESILEELKNETSEA